MKRHLILAAAAFLCGASIAQAQTSYPMLMSVHPTAAQVGQTSEHVVQSRYSMFGAYKVLIEGEGVTAEITSPMTPGKDGKPPNLTKLKVRFAVTADARPGVRDFRIATPQGASTLGQLVIVRDPIVVEKEKNNTAADAQPVTLPATLCGVIGQAEDVDYYAFEAAAGQSLSFHVRSMRLEDRIHDLQTHSDPIIALRSSNGATLVTADNHFAGDPFLSHTFEQAGRYLLEIRDVRYQGNRYWEYSVEVNDRPFVSNVFPMGIARGEEAALQLIGAHLPENRTAPVKLPADANPGPRWLQLPLGEALTNPVPVIVGELPSLVENEMENNAPENGQAITIPAGISGRVESEADIDCYTFAAKKGERFSFEVIAHRWQSPLDSHLRILDQTGKELSRNDDLRLYKRNFHDSWIEFWAAPADGNYSIEIRDLHLRGGHPFVYYVKATRSQPYFALYLDTDKTQLTPGTSGVLFVNTVRKNGFTGEISLQIDGLPPGVTASCGRILAGERDGAIILQATADAELAISNIVVTGTAAHKVGESKTLDLSAVATPYQEIYQPGGGRGHWPVDAHAVSVGAPSDIRAVKLSTYDVVLKPGESVKIDVEIERAPGFDKNVTLDPTFRHLSGTFADTLPPGVTVDSKNSKTLLTGKESKGHITLKASDKAAPVEKQQVSVMANISLNFVMKATYSSQPLLVTVVKP